MDLLPSEILPLILRHLTAPRDRARVRRVSRAFKEAADSPESWDALKATLRVTEFNTRDLDDLAASLRLPGAEGLHELTLEFARPPQVLSTRPPRRRTVHVEVPAGVSKMTVNDPRDRSWDLFGTLSFAWEHPSPTLVWRGSMQPMPDHPIVRAMRGGLIDAPVSIWYYACMPSQPFRRLRVTEGFAVLNYTSGDSEFYLSVGAERDARSICGYLWPDGERDLSTCPVDRIHLMLASPWVMGWGHAPREETLKAFRPALERIVKSHPFCLMRHEFTRDGVRLYVRESKSG